MRICAARSLQRVSRFFTSAIRRTREPSWQLAQPFRYVAHNGEINTVISNRRWLRAREREIRKRIGVGKWFRMLEENVSDSASFDNALELKLLEGKSVEAAMLALVPPAFSQDPFLSPDVRAALEALSREGEPWDGPAALVFSDGVSVGVKLDRNGLRPMRYTVDARWLGDCRFGDGTAGPGRLTDRRAASSWAREKCCWPPRRPVLCCAGENS